MSTDALGYSIVLLVIASSFIAVKFRNLLLTLGASILWAVLLAFILQNTTAGTNFQQMLILGIVTFICAFALISLFNRRRGAENGGNFMENFTKLHDNSQNEESKSPTKGRGLMDLSNEEYRAVIRARMHRREGK